MLLNTFCHVNGIGQKTEARLWEAGIYTWPDFSAASHFPLSPSKISRIRHELTESQYALEERRARYFADRLPSDQQWRLFPDFRDRIAYIDIETTGMSRDGNRITTIALYDGKDIRCYVYGQNLENFVEDISHYDLLVTYNGKSFDLPFIERFFNIRLGHGHVDLRWVLKSLGYSGGLKGCEKRFGLARDGLEGVDGYFAVLLWHEYEKSGDPRVLETLLAYNIEDVVNLEYLMHAAYNLKLAQTPFASRFSLCPPSRPIVPMVPDSEVIQRIKRF